MPIQVRRICSRGNRLFQFCDDGLSPSCLGGDEHRSSPRTRPYAVDSPQQVWRSAERRRLRFLEPRNRSFHPTTISADSSEIRKQACVARALWLRDDFQTDCGLYRAAGRQKGVHLVRHAMFYSLWNGAQFVLLGPSPDPSINGHFWHLKHFLNDNPDCHLELGFDADLAHLVYAGADMLVTPSNYEPCGLVQMIAQKYGTAIVSDPSRTCGTLGKRTAMRGTTLLFASVVALH
jgi:glycosyltransferase involved in cell wall biosynthesis